LKKLWLLYLYSILILTAKEYNLDNYLSYEKSLIFDYKEELNRLQSSILRRSWINPITIDYSWFNSTQPSNGTRNDRTFSIGIDQPIFKSGGIYSAVRYANAKEGTNSANLTLQKRSMIVQALGILFDLHINKLKQRQLKYMIRNDDIDIQKKREQYEAGLLDGSFLDQAIIKRNQDKTKLLALKLTNKELRSSFSILSDKNPDRLKLPKLHIISKDDYIKDNIELFAKSMYSKEQEYYSYMTIAKYLPTISLQARYYKNDPDSEFGLTPGIDNDYTNYGIHISIPLHINSVADIESSRVSALKAAIEYQDSKKSVANEYELIKESLKLLDQKIALSASDEKLYSSLIRSTTDQVASGEKTELDLEIMKNSKEMARIDKKVYRLQKQKLLLKLYEKVNR